MGIASSVIDFLLFCICIFAFTKKLTVKRFAGAIVLVSMVHIAQATYAASMQGMDVYTAYLQSFNAILSQMNSTISTQQQEQMAYFYKIFASCWVAVTVFQAAAQVTMALCLLWVVNKITKRKLNWGAFSKIDLSIWTVVPLIVGILLLVLSWLPQVPQNDKLYVIALNWLAISILPLFAQGGAAFKGIMNRMKLSGGMQIVLMVCGLVTSLAFVVTPLIGLVDYWANFRKLPRDAKACE